MGNLKKFLAGLALSGAAMTASASENPYIAGVESKQMASDTVAMIKDVDWEKMDETLRQAYYAQRGKLSSINPDQKLEDLSEEQKRNTVLNSLEMYEDKTGVDMSFYKKDFEKKKFNPKTKRFEKAPVLKPQKETFVDQLKRYEKTTGESVFDALHQYDRNKDKISAKKTLSDEQIKEIDQFKQLKESLPKEKVNPIEIVKRAGHSK